MHPIAYNILDSAASAASSRRLAPFGHAVSGYEVTVAGSFAETVMGMNLRALELETLDGSERKMVYIPNSDVFGKAIIVHKKMPVTAMDAMVTEEEAEAAEAGKQ